MVMKHLFALVVCLSSAANAVSLSALGSAYNGVVVALPLDLKDATGQRELLAGLRQLLSETSQVLHRATGLHLAEVIFQIPPSWEGSPEWVYTDTVSSADIYVTANDDSVFGAAPHAVQFGGCGRQGLRLNVPARFLTAGSPVNFVSKAKLMSREWIKYRYGVFDENGFVNDARFPQYSAVLGTDDVTVTDCTNAPVRYTFRDKYGKDCNPGIDSKTGLPNSECLAQPESESNHNVTSSLMYLQSLPNVEFLCGDDAHPHQSLARNKQNLMCGRSSIKDVIKRHSDFTNRRVEEGSAFPPETIYRFARETQNRVVVAVDISSGLTKYKDLIRNAIADLIYSLPSGSELGMTSAADNLHIISEEEDLKARNNLVLEMGLVFKNAEPCPLCAVKKAMEMLSGGVTQKSGRIFLMSAANPTTLDPAILEGLGSSGLCLDAVLFPNATKDGYAELVGRTSCGRIYAIPEDTSLATLKHLYEAMESSIRPGSPKVIKLKTSEIKQNSALSFTVDETVTSFDLWISNNSSEMEIDRSNVQVYPDNGIQPQVKTIPAVRPHFFVLRVENAMAAKWTCNLDYVSPLFLKITAVLKGGDPLDAEAWITDTNTEGTDVQMPVIIYTRISRGVHPIIGARVRAEIQAPDGHKVTHDLWDNGLGDPDITKNDGIHSRYFVDFTTPGEYEVVVTVDDSDGNARKAKPSPAVSGTCCGSEVAIGNKEDIKPFFRELKIYFTARGQRPERGFSPSTILDLQVTVVTERMFKLNWTAPGGKKDHGKAVRYIFNQQHTYEDLMKDSGVGTLADGLKFNVQGMIPKQLGETEEMLLNVTDETSLNTSYVLSVTSLNENGVKSDMSNAVEIFVPEILGTTPVDDTSPSTVDNNADTNQNGPLSKATIGYIVGAVFLILLIICGYVVFYCHMKRKQKRQDADRDKRTETEPKESKVENNNKGDGSVTADEWKLDASPISPVNSLPASVLLYHHEQVKEARRKRKDPPLFTLERLAESTESMSESSPANGLGPRTVPEEPTRVTRDISREYGDDGRVNTKPDFPDRPAKPQRRITNV